MAQVWFMRPFKPMKTAKEEFRNARILVIDDEQTSAQLLSRMLERAGYAVCITISDPTVAASRLTQLQPDIVLLDLHMEPISGIDILRHISSELPPNQRPPVLMLTADTSQEAKYEALEAGATGFLAKPLDPLEVLLRIEQMLTSRLLMQQCHNYSLGLERLVQERTEVLQRQTHELEQTLSELRDAQQQVIQQERLRALGTMASGIAHDLNNGLSLILGYGDMAISLADRKSTDSEIRSHLQQMVKAARDNSVMVKRLREFYRPGASNEDRQAVDLNDLVSQAISMTAPRWQSVAEANGASIHVTTDLGVLPLIAGSPAELREVLTNLIFNAVDAMPHGGKLAFRTTPVSDGVELSITDTGTGMTDECRSKCLDPFFTTKRNCGSGLGLSVSYGIVRRHGGTLTVKSRLDEGTTFVIRLPLTEAPIVPASGAWQLPVKPLRVLVVDDHPGILEIVSAYLAEDRHTVETAKDATVAMEKYRSGHFDLIITDRAMPEINGDEFAAAIKQIDPDKPVIMLTGFADLMHETGQLSADVDLVVAKPARLDDLRQAIRQVTTG